MTTASFPRTKTTEVTTRSSTRTKKKTTATRRKKGETKQRFTVDVLGVYARGEASDWISSVLFVSTISKRSLDTNQIRSKFGLSSVKQTHFQTLKRKRK